MVIVTEHELEEIRTLVEEMGGPEFASFYNGYTDITHEVNKMSFFHPELLPVARAIEPVTKVIVGEWVRRKKRGWEVNE